MQDQPTRTKRCSRCGEAKPLSEFYRWSRGRDGYRAACKPCADKSGAASRAANRDQRLAQQREKQRGRYASDAEYRTRVLEANADWCKRTGRPKKLYEQLKAAGVPLDSGSRHRELMRVFTRDLGVCGICSEVVARADATMDHIVPLSAGGRHEDSNVQLAHRSCNSRKGAQILGAA